MIVFIRSNDPAINQLSRACSRRIGQGLASERDIHVFSDQTERTSNRDYAVAKLAGTAERDSKTRRKGCDGQVGGVQLIAPCGPPQRGTCLIVSGH